MKSVACPYCGISDYPAPFVGRVAAQCPSCGLWCTLETNGVSFETSQITARRLVNGARLRGLPSGGAPSVAYTCE